MTVIGSQPGSCNKIITSKESVAQRLPQQESKVVDEGWNKDSMTYHSSCAGSDNYHMLLAIL
jgi:hypothetical protein